MREKFSNIRFPRATVIALLLGAVLVTALAVPKLSEPRSAFAASYSFSPSFTATGSNSYNVSSSTSTKLADLSLTAWFKTTQLPSDFAFIANKGGIGTDKTAGENLNYGIWLTKSGRINAGFEDRIGTNYFVSSPNAYNDGSWHHVALTYGGSTIYLYIDGQKVASKDIQATPDAGGNQAFTVGANSLVSGNYFVGSIDEVRLYNRPLTMTEVSELSNTGTTSTTGQVLYLSFGTTTTTSSPTTSPTSTSTGYVVTVSKSSSTFTAKDSTGKVLYSSSNAARAIQSGIDAIKAKSGGGTLHITAGTYSISETIILDKANDIVIEGDSRDTTILQCGIAGGKIFEKNGSIQTKNVTVRDLRLDGMNISGKLLNFGNIVNLLVDNVILERHNLDLPGVYLVDLQDSTIQNSIIRNPNNVGDAIAISGERITFQKNEVTRQGARGAGLGSGHLLDSKIINNNFHDFKGYAAITLENHNLVDGVNSHKNVEIAYNTFTNLDANAIRSNGYSASGGAFYNLHIHHNTIQNAVGHGIMLNAFDTKPNVVTYNSNIHDNTLKYTAGMNLGPLKSTQINNNIIDHTSNWRGYGIYLYKGSNNVTMDGNEISNTQRAAYYYTGSTEIYINGQKMS